MQSFLTRTSLLSLKIPHRPPWCNETWRMHWNWMSCVYPLILGDLHHKCPCWWTCSLSMEQEIVRDCLHMHHVGYWQIMWICRQIQLQVLSSQILELNAIKVCGILTCGCQSSFSRSSSASNRSSRSMLSEEDEEDKLKPWRIGLGRYLVFVYLN